MKILLIEDVAELASPLIRYLALEDISVVWKTRADEGIYALSVAPFDVVILDLGLPDRDGREVCREMRSHGYVLPILALTSRSRVSDKIEMLDMGADDYMVKPADYDELIARLKALTRRDMSNKSQDIIIGRLKIAIRAKTVMFDDQVVDLSPREFSLLTYLATHHQSAHSRETLLEAVWGESATRSEVKVVDVYIGYLRKKLSRECIETQKGAGYKISSLS